MTRYLILENGLPSLDHLPAKHDEQLARSECERLNLLVKQNNDRHEMMQHEPHYRGKSFLCMKDNRVFSYKEIE